jgi:glycine/D-amino acid oxidase-like deaminating enzyme
VTIAPQNRPRWDDHDDLPLAPLGDDAEAEVCVVGLGGTGLSCITEALALGARSVIGIDAIGVAAGAAGRNGGLLVSGTSEFHHDAVAALGRERTVAITERTVAEIDRIACEALRIAASAQVLDDCERQRAQMVADGFAAQSYAGPEGDGILLPTDAVCNPLLRCRTIAVRALERGARLHGATTARTIEPGRVRTDGGTIRARHVFVCIDGNLGRLVPEVASDARTARLQMLATAPAPEVSFTRPVSTRDGYDYWQQLPDASIVLGGGRDVAADGEWTSESTPGAAVQEYLTSVLRTKLGVGAEVTHRWAAVVSYTETGLPVFRTLGDGVYVMGAYSGTGNVVGAILGRGAAQLALTGRSDLLSPFLA